ncbi:MAG: outer membrane protein assembly factor BamB [Pseudomonadota bacterium]
MRMTKKLVGLGVLALLAGCSSLNPFGSKSKGGDPAPLTDIKGTMAVRTAWTASVGKGAGAFAPVQDGGSIYAAGADGAIVALDAASGRQLWRVAAGTSLSAGVSVADGVLVVGAVKGGLLAFDTSGKALWKAQASSEILSAPVVGQGMVVVLSLDSRVVGYDAKTGDKKWTVQRIAPALTMRNSPGMVINGKEVIVAQPGGKLLALALATGATRWEAALAEGRGATELERVTDVGGVPFIFERDVCAASYQGRIGCFDVATGAPRWNKEFSSHVGVGADQRFVFGADDKGNLAAFNRDGGASAWRNDKLALRRLSTPVSVGRAVAVGDLEGVVHFLSREDGAFLARVKTDGSAIHSAGLIAGSNLIFQTQSGTVTAIAVE